MRLTLLSRLVLNKSRLPLTLRPLVYCSTSVTCQFTSKAVPSPNLNISQHRSFATTKMSVSVRPLEQGDQSTWLSLWAQYNEFYKRTIPSDVTSNTFSRLTDSDKSRMYAAVAVDPESNTVVGFVHWYPHPSTSSINEVVYLHDLFVDPSIRNKGAGGALIKHVYEHSKDVLNAHHVYWHTQYFNHRAQLLYVKLADRTDFVQYSHLL